MTSNPLLWEPTTLNIESTAMHDFSHWIAKQLHKPELIHYAQLHAFSVTQQDCFWRAFTRYANIKMTGQDKVGLSLRTPAQQSRYFPNAQLNLAENLLARNDEEEAIVFIAENYYSQRLSWHELHQQVSALQQALDNSGLKVGDRVAAITPNSPVAVIAMLATLSLGGTWCSCSPDFGAQGILERFAQIKPTFLISCDGYWYNHKAYNILEKLTDVSDTLPSLKKIIIAPLLEPKRTDFPIQKSISWDKFIAPYHPKPCKFIPLAFDHPAFILFSSGTTGKPKCFMHAQGAYLLTNRLDLMLHNDIRTRDTSFFYTTCGWMMWNWLIGALGIGSKIVLYDGSPFAEGPQTLFALAAQENITLLGLSPKLLSTAEKQNYHPKDHFDLPTLRRIVSTGSPLSGGNFDYVYQSIKADIHLSPLSGGTDILGCFLAGEPRKGVYRGEMQVPLLGKDVVVMSDQAEALEYGTGELVCKTPFLGMPLGFWDDPKHHRYNKAYFSRFLGYWCHGDYLERTKNQGYIIHGRSDTTLNPNGVRIGTAEIYHAIEDIPEISDGVAIGQQWDQDIRVILFVVLTQDIRLDQKLIDKIKQYIKTRCSARHVPAKIIQAPAIPRTRSGKISEQAVHDMVHNKPVRNHQALENPESLDFFAKPPELQSQ